MPAGHELFGAQTFIITKLKADAPLAALVGTRIYSEMAPETTPPVAFPYIIVAFQSGMDRNAIPVTARIWLAVRYLVKVITQADSLASANAICDRIDAVLIGQEGPVPAENVQITKIWRESVEQYIEVEAGRRLNHVGGSYRTLVTAYP